MNRQDASRLALVLLTALGTSHLEVEAYAQGLDRDGLLVDAPATPEATTLRISGGGASTFEASGPHSSLVGSLMWVPLNRLSLDLGRYWQSTTGAGPAIRARFQILSHQDQGIDLSLAVRFKAVGFRPGQGEVEVMTSAGRTFGDLDLVINGVFGVETADGSRDVEIKSATALRLVPGVRVGVEGRVQIELESEDEAPANRGQGRDFELVLGPTGSWLLADAVHLQLMAGLAVPKGSVGSGAIGLLGASFDL